jgi:hypothetical protein
LVFGNPNPNEGYEEPITNNKRNEIRKAVMVDPAPGQSGMVNPKASTARGARDEFSMSSNNIILVDIDDTLVNGITPNEKIIDYVNSKWGSNRIVILTGRKASRKGETIRELDRWGVRFDDLYLNDTDKPSHQYKWDKAEELMNKRFNIVEAIENNPFTYAGYQRLGIKVKTPDSFSMIPSGFLQGLAIFEERTDAEDYSYQMGCGGVVEEVEYMGKKQFQACSYRKQEKMKSIGFKAEDEKKMLYSPLMVPGILIPRLDENTGERYFVRFTKETIEKIQQKFMIEQRLRKTNYEHTNHKFNDIIMVESWLVSGDSDKAYSLGYSKEDIPVGTWMVGYKILDTPEGDTLWNDYIKTGKVRGLSAEGEFLMKFSREKTDEYLLEQIINIIQQID